MAPQYLTTNSRFNQADIQEIHSYNKLRICLLHLMIIFLIWDRFNTGFCGNFRFFQEELILILMETLTHEKKQDIRGNISQTIPASLIISISYWCSCWLFSKQLRLCQETAKYAISAISWQHMTRNQRIYFKIPTSWVTKTCVEASFKYLMVVRM